jgi:hypothetical protein
VSANRRAADWSVPDDVAMALVARHLNHFTDAALTAA